MKEYREYLYPISWILAIIFAVYLFFEINWIIVVAFLGLLFVNAISILILYNNFLWWPQSTWIDRSLVSIENVEVPTMIEGKTLKGLVIRDKKADPNEKQIGILFHHGYRGHKEYYFQFYIPLALNGCTILCIDARGHGKSKDEAFNRDYFPGIMSDVKKEISFLESLPGVDPTKLVMMGHSMGGTATLTQGYSDERIKKLVAISTPYDHIELFQKNKTFTVKFIKRSVLKQVKDDILEWDKLISAKHFVNQRTRIPNKDRVYLVHCKQDDLIPFNHAIELKEALSLPEENVLFLEKPDFKFWMSAHNVIGQAPIISDFLVKVIRNL